MTGVDVAGDVAYVSTQYGCRVHRIDLVTSAVTVFAGSGPLYPCSAASGDGGPATSATFSDVRAVAAKADGTVYIADGARVREVDPAGIVRAFAGTGIIGNSGDGGPALAASFGAIEDLAVDDDGIVYIRDGVRLRRVNALGLVEAVAGGGATFVDGGLATATAIGTGGVGLDPAGSVLLTSTSGYLRRVDTAGSGRIWTVAGPVDLNQGLGRYEFARLDDPRALSYGPALALVAAGASGTVAALRDDEGLLENVIGRYGQPAPTAAWARFRASSFGSVDGVAQHPDGSRIFLSETSAHALHEVTVVDPADERTWTIAALAGAGAGFADGPLATARLREPAGLAYDATGDRVFVADAGNHVIRVIDRGAATIATVAGTPEVLGVGGDGGPSAEARLNRPRALARCPSGDLYIADTGNHRIRRVDGAGVITTVLGDGTDASSGEGAPSTSFPVAAPAGLVCDAAGNLYITSTTTVRVLAADAAGVVDGTGPVLTIYGAPPRDTYPATVTRCLTGIALVDDATVHVTDACTGLLVELGRQRLAP
ncbi:MAG: hypothetical protein R2939_07880 [Kofleriaceae bacterium]